MSRKNDLWIQTNYQSPTSYIVDGRIIEYDLEKANISTLLDAGLITRELYENLYNAPRMERQIYVGNMIRNDRSIFNAIADRIRMSRKVLFDTLDLNFSNVLSIKNDAVFVISSSNSVGADSVRVNENLVFRRKSQFRSFYRMFKLEFYYDYDIIRRSHILEVKGLGDYGVEFHKQFILAEFEEIFYQAIKGGSRAALTRIKEFYPKYMSKDLDIRYYHRLDSNSQLDLIQFSNFSSYKADYLFYNDKSLIDISYNKQFIDTLIKYYIDYSCAH